MKSYVLRFRASDQAIFDAIRDGKKTIETRAATVKFKPIKAGDRFVFVCGKQRFELSIKRVKSFASPAELATAYPISKILPGASLFLSLRRCMHHFLAI